jgi:hypothetical protein
MKTIGIEIDKNKAIFFVLENDGISINNLTNDFKTLILSDDKDNSQIRNFQSIIFTHFDTINSNRIAILKRQSTGKFASSPISFKIEALIQCYSKLEIEFVAPLTVTTFYKKNNFDIPITYNYQEKAAQLANYLLYI